MLRERIGGLRRVGSDYLGDLDGTISVFGRHCSANKLTDLLIGNIADWEWRSAQRSDMLRADVPFVALFIKYIDWNEYITINKLRSITKHLGNNESFPINVSIRGVMIGDIVFLKSKSPTFGEFSLDIRDTDHLILSNTIPTKSYLKGYFNMHRCKFYYKFPDDSP